MIAARITGAMPPEPLYVAGGAGMVFKTRSTSGEDDVAPGIWCRDAAARTRFVKAARVQGVEPLGFLEETTVLCRGMMTPVAVADELTWTRLQEEMEGVCGKREQPWQGGDRV